MHQLSNAPRGIHHLELTQGDSGNNTASAILHLDLLDGITPATRVTLDFWQKSSGITSNQFGRLEAREDANSPWSTILTFLELTDYTHYTFDLDAEITDAGLERLQKALPNCKVAHYPTP